MLTGPIWIPETAYFSLGYVILVHIPSDYEKMLALCGLEPEKALQQVQTAVHVALQLGQYDPTSVP